MATKKKVLLEQETPVPENTAPADGTISSAGPPAEKGGACGRSRTWRE